MFETNEPVTWAKMFAKSLQWPVIVGAAFWLGRYVKELEMRLHKAETNLQALIERHMPAIHRALAEIKGEIHALLSRK